MCPLLCDSTGHRDDAGLPGLVLSSAHIERTMMALHLPSFGLPKAWLTLAGSLLTLAVATSLPVPAWAQAGATGSLRDTSSRCGGDVNAVQSGTASSFQNRRNLLHLSICQFSARFVL